MRKALVLMMTTCILFAGCIEGLTGDVEEVIEELAPGCNDPTAINYDENDTTATTCVTENALYESIGEFTKMSGGNNTVTGNNTFMKGIQMTISGVDEEMGMGAYTIVSTMAENENTAYSGTDLATSGMTISQSWTIQESGDGTILQASYMGESFLMHSAMSWDDVSDDGDDSDRDDDDSEVTQEECEERGGNWTATEETEGRADNSTQGTGDANATCYYGEVDDDSDGGMDMELPDPMDFLSMLDGVDDDCDDAAGAVNPDACSAPVETACEYMDESHYCLRCNMTLDDGQTMDVELDVDETGITITSIHMHMDMDDGSHMEIEMLTTEEAAALLTIDTTLGYEALPFTLEEADAEDDDVFICDNGQEIPADWVNDGMDDCGDNSDEGVEEQEEGPLNRTFTVTSDAEFDFAGSFEDYSVVLANCVEETDDMGDTTLTCDESNNTVFSLADSSSTEGRSGEWNCGKWCSIDSDSSGTLTNGDVIIVDGNFTNWTHVRLHSTSADAYSDENPLQELPGFTAMLGVLSLMGAAMMGRRD